MRICAGGVLIRGDKLLLAKRSDDRAFYPGVWDIIGGHCERGETPAETLVREFEEEINITPRSFHEVAVLDEPCPVKHVEAQYHVFVVTAWDGAERLLGAEHSELRWVPRGSPALAACSPRLRRHAPTHSGSRDTRLTIPIAE